VRVDATPSAADAVRRVIADRRTDLVIVLSNGCCESTAPYLYDHYIPEPGSEPVGDIAGVPVLAPGWIRKLYVDDALTVDVEAGIVDDSFSLESEHGCRLVLRAPSIEHHH